MSENSVSFMWDHTHCNAEYDPADQSLYIDFNGPSININLASLTMVLEKDGSHSLISDSFSMRGLEYELVELLEMTKIEIKEEV